MVIVDLNDATAERLAFLNHMAANPALGQTTLIATGSTGIVAKAMNLTEMERVLVTRPEQLPDAVRSAFYPRRTSPWIFLGKAHPFPWV